MLIWRRSSETDCRTTRGDREQKSAKVFFFFFLTDYVDCLTVELMSYASLSGGRK